MKRQHTTFSVEIKKSRTQAERHHLPPRRLFDVVPPAEAPRMPQNQAVPKIAEPIAAPRILPSIVESKWSQSELTEPTRRKRSPGEGKRGQMELDLSAVSEDMNDAATDTPVHTEVDLPAATDGAVEKGATSTHDVQPASDESANSKARTVRKKVPAPVEPAQADEPTPEVVPTRHAEQIGPSTSVRPRSSERRLTKRLAAAVELPRSERWKRRLHPASWRGHQRSTPV